ncbi:hypothetical protein C4J81_11990 [Deltaproteobacteria bacterium Smac51]|nr:hypothetical protein C4J81_11990 [Deltaproteobacteria bacterium Smac51]
MPWRYELTNTREEALAEIVGTVGLGLWEITSESEPASGTAEDSVIHIDEQACQILGLTRQELKIKVSELYDLIHEDDRARIRDSIVRLMKAPGLDASTEYRILGQSDGEWHWVRSFGKSFPDSVGGGVYVRGGTQKMQDGPAFQSMLEQVRSANDRAQIMLDATPLCCNFWDENVNNIDCNQEAANLFDLASKEEYLEKFHLLSPEYQPDGQLSAEKAMKQVKEAFEKGKVVFEWMHQKLNGEPIPAEITLVRVKRGEKFIVAGYTRDLREYKHMMAEMRKADERTQIMLDATPLCCNFWDENSNNIDCNQEAANLFGLSSKEEYLENFHRLSPEYQPDGQLSADKAMKMVKEAFEKGRIVFEWMHQKLDGEPIPAEITLVRVKRGDSYIVLGYTRDLREYKRMMAEMREADERTKIMLDATPLCCNLWDSNFNNIDCNEEAVKLFGLRDKREYLDRFFELSPERQPDGQLSSEKARGMITTAFREGQVIFEWMHQKLNGDPVPSEITLVRVKRGDEYIVAGYTRDLREYKKMMAEMREADERTKIMLDATPLCCNLWDRNFNNIDCNQEAVKLFNLRDKQEYLDRFFQLSPERQPDGQLSSEKAQGMINTAFRRGGVVFEWMHQKLDGSPIPSEITLVRVKRGDEYIVAGYTRDLREYKKMMAEIKQVESDLRLARDAAEQSAKSKSEFLANMSHEIRTPMNAILGMLNLVQSEEPTALPPRQADYIHKAEQSTKTLLRIINDILDFSKIEAGRLEMENVEFSISEVLQQMSDVFGQAIADKGLTFNISSPDGLPPRLCGDSLRLAQVLLNLISNSVKFTEKGSVSLSVVEVSRREGRTFLQFTVTDTGIGMTREQIDGLFTPFTQADTSTTRKYGGTGLGLAISKKLANMMHGEIWCSSEPGQGSAFYMTAEFELAAEGDLPAADGAGRKEAEASKLPHADWSEIRPILLVEDNDMNQLIAKKLLEKKGLKVEVANNGQEAIDKLQATDYELVLMDIQMPVMDGISATLKIREMEKFNNLPIIAMTAHAMSGDREKSLESGMNDHVTKPIDMKMLYAVLEKWIDLREAGWAREAGQ